MTRPPKRTSALRGWALALLSLAAAVPATRAADPVKTNIDWPAVLGGPT